MTRYIALLRAVNVGGTGKLPMADVRSMCRDAGFTRVETYIASGNVIFESKRTASKVKAELEARLLACCEARRDRSEPLRRGAGGGSASSAEHPRWRAPATF